MGRQMLDCGDVLDESQANGSVKDCFVRRTSVSTVIGILEYDS